MSTVVIKHSLTAGNTPASLLDGELAINETDELFFYKNASGTLRSFGLPAAPVEMLAHMGLQVNGAMEIDQEHLGAAVALSNGTSKYIIDQWKFAYNHTANTAVFSANQALTTGGVPLGPNLRYGFRAVSSTALASPNIGDYALCLQYVEGYRWERMCYGTTMARPVTIGFWVYATATGTASVSVRNNDSTRSYVDNFTIAAINTWQWVTITIPGDQAGVWQPGTSVGATIGFCFAAGTTYQTTAKNWVVGNFLGTPQTTNFFATNANQVIITGVIVLPTLNLPPAARVGLLQRSFDEEMLYCQRYFWIGNQIYSPVVISNAFTGGAYIGGSWLFPVQMRVAPTLTVYGTWTVVNVNQPIPWLASPSSFAIYATSLSAGNSYYFPGTTTAGVTASARM